MMIQGMEGMDLAERIGELSRRIAKRRTRVETEEATKHALVMPWITHILGYNVFDPDEVVPEYTADIGTKKGEKVDYAIMGDGKPLMLIECKQEGADLEKQGGNQLYRYFGATEAEIAVLTNGIEYRIYSDIDEPNRMDSRPFLVIDMAQPEGIDLEALRSFTKTNYDTCEIRERAKDLLYSREALKAIEREWAEPNEEFVKYIAKQFHSGVKTKGVMERMTRAVKKAQEEFVTGRVDRRLKRALSGNDAEADGQKPKEEQPEADAGKKGAEPSGRIHALRIRGPVRIERGDGARRRTQRYRSGAAGDAVEARADRGNGQAGADRPDTGKPGEDARAGAGAEQRKARNGRLVRDDEPLERGEGRAPRENVRNRRYKVQRSGRSRDLVPRPEKGFSLEGRERKTRWNAPLRHKERENEQE